MPTEQCVVLHSHVRRKKENATAGDGTLRRHSIPTFILLLFTMKKIIPFVLLVLVVGVGGVLAWNLQKNNQEITCGDGLNVGCSDDRFNVPPQNESPIDNDTKPPVLSDQSPDHAGKQLVYFRSAEIGRAHV